ncbi:UPF0146 family protein [Halostella litorea]|uniref:UPF0146 family protein n=1 Tax=Halostella litorea TaxID=2528831 RepID=UPI001091AAF7
MTRSSTDALADRLARYDRVVEVGVGRRTDVAAALSARGVAVVATDVRERPVPEGVRFVRDDVTDPDPAVYADAGAVYALNAPPELHRPLRDAAERANADLLFTTLGGDGPAVPVERETLPGETLYRAVDGPHGRR